MSTSEQEELGTREGPAEGPETTPAAAPVEGAIEVRYYGHTDVGLIREHNEDNFLVADLAGEERFRVDDEPQVVSVGGRGFVLAVCDGMGGAAAGEVASQMAVDTLHEVLRSAEPTEDAEAFARRLVYAIEESGHRIFSAAKLDRSRRGMGTTSTVAGLVNRTLFVGQVGDSRAYLLRGGKLGQISKDQSLVNQLIEAGQLTEEEAEAFEHSNIILQALGTTENVNVDVTYVELCEGDRLMLCSDGLSGLVHGEMIREVMAEERDLQACCRRLVDMANAGGGHDNITCVVADFSGPGLLPAEGAAPASYEKYPVPLGYGEPEDSAALSREPTMKSATAKPGADVKRHEGEEPRQERASFGLFALIGIALLAFGALAFLFTRPETPVEPLEASPRAAREATEPAPVQNVEVHVRTTVEGAQLFVDGEDLGSIAAGEDVVLEVVPGRYAIEVRVGDASASKKVVDIEAGDPQEVFLAAPKPTTPVRRDPPANPSGAAPSPSEEGAPEAPEAPEEASEAPAPTEPAEDSAPGEAPAPAAPSAQPAAPAPTPAPAAPSPAPAP